jgi:hypothetical protein
MQNGGQRVAVFIFLLECVPSATKKTKKRLASTERNASEFFCGAILRVTHLHASKKNKIKQNLATQGTIGVRVLPFSPLSRAAARKNHRAVRFLR